MMFYGLCAALCLAVLFLVATLTAGPCLAAARVLRHRLDSARPRTVASAFFAIHILPLLLACLVTFGFTLPAFLKLEPRSTAEVMSLKLIILACAGALSIAVLAARVMRALWATSRAERQWRGFSQEMHVNGVPATVYCVKENFPFVAVTGLLRPRVFVGRAIADLLSAAELRAALAHEMAHARSFDNMKQLFLKSVRLPGFGARVGSSIWANASEAAADEEAMDGGTSPLDLSSALVKMGRLNRRPLCQPQVLASQFLPYATSSSLPMRIARLERWLEARTVHRGRGARAGLEAARREEKLTDGWDL